MRYWKVFYALYRYIIRTFIGVNKIAKTTDFPQSKAKNQVPPLISSSDTSLQNRGSHEINTHLLEELGVSGQQFKILFDHLPNAVALHKMVYENGKPVGLILLESNKAYNGLKCFKEERIGEKEAEFNPNAKEAREDWIGIYDKLATTGLPQQLEMYCESTGKWYQLYAYSPKKTYFVSAFVDITEQKKEKARELEKLVEMAAATCYFREKVPQALRDVSRRDYGQRY